MMKINFKKKKTIIPKTTITKEQKKLPITRFVTSFKK